MADYKLVKHVSGEDGDASVGAIDRSCYSFCMCPGGQVIPFFIFLRTSSENDAFRF